LVSFDPTIGAKIKKTRPALVLQNDIANRASPITIVAAISSQFEERIYPTEVLIKAPEAGLAVDSVLHCSTKSDPSTGIGWFVAWARSGPRP
jgi:mRNA interferase MazF